MACFVLALRYIGAARTGAYFSLAPFVGAGVSLLLLREGVGPLFFGAAVLMGIGVWLHLSEKHEHEHHHERLEHSHRHVHDEHHQHPPGVEATEPHAHLHVHQPMTHSHAHFPDIHHRHNHAETQDHRHDSGTPATT